MEELDNQVEQWFKDKFDRNFDFDVEDGLVKLKKLGLVKSSKDTLKALELEKAIALLDKRWDNYFSGN